MKTAKVPAEQILFIIVVFVSSLLGTESNSTITDTDKVYISIGNAVAKSNANRYWFSDSQLTHDVLEEGGYRIFTHALEKVWLVDSPVLFIGEIMDIKSKNSIEYTITLKLILPANPYYVWHTSIFLYVSAPKDKIDMFVANYPKVRMSEHNSVAVIANIKSVTSSEDGDKRYGYGKMIEIIYVGKYGEDLANWL